MELKVATFNCWKDASDAQVEEDLRRVLRTKPDLVGLQEAAGRARVLRRVAGAEYGVVIPNGERASTQVPVLYRRATMGEPVTRRFRLGCLAGRTGLPPARYINRVRFQLPSGVHLVHYNTHMNSHVERAGLPIPLPRLAAFRLHLQRLTYAMARSHQRVVVLATADWNVDQRVDGKVSFFPKRAMAAIGATSNYAVRPPARGSRGTHGRRFIDAVFLREHPYARITDWKILAGLHSDHNALVVTVELS